MKWLEKLTAEMPLDYQQGYQDGFNGCLKVLKKALKQMGKLEIKAVQRVHNDEKRKRN